MSKTAKQKNPLVQNNPVEKKQSTKLNEPEAATNPVVSGQDPHSDLSAAEEALPPLPAWSCRVQKNDADGAPELETLYVGDKYLLRCEGPFVDNLGQKLKLEPLNEVDQYAVAILEFRTVDNDGLWATVTSYKPGTHKLSGFQLVDGQRIIPVEGGELQIKSALQELPPEQLNNPEAMKMTMLGPFLLAMPWWYWALWAAALLAIFGVLARFIWRKVQRKKILENLARQATALTPYNQFNKEIREQMRKYTSTTQIKDFGAAYMKDLDQSFRMYLLRELLVPANEWSTRAVMRDVKMRHKKIYKNLGPQVRRVLIEFDRARRDPGIVTVEDCEQMREMSRRAVDGVYRMKRLSR